MEFPKIAVESKEDVFYIHKILKSKARSLLEAEIAETEYEKQVIKIAKLLINKWLEKVFETSGHGIRINGLDYEKVMSQKEDFEPVDEQLQSNVRQLLNTNEQYASRVCVKSRAVFREKIHSYLQKSLEKETECHKIDTETASTHQDFIDYEKMQSSIEALKSIYKDNSSSLESLSSFSEKLTTKLNGLSKELLSMETANNAILSHQDITCEDPVYEPLEDEELRYYKCTDVVEDIIDTEKSSSGKNNLKTNKYIQRYLSRLRLRQQIRDLQSELS